MLSLFKFYPCAEVRSGRPRCGKTQWVFIFLSKDSITERLKTFYITKPVNSYIINYKDNIQPFTVIKTKIVK